MRLVRGIPVVLGLLLAASSGLAGETTLLSRSSEGVQGNAGSIAASVSADGRYVAFQSDASNLVAGDTNNARDIFVRDRATGATTRVSVSSAGEQGNAYSYAPSISADGRFVAFFSVAYNLVPGDANHNYDVFVHDRKLQRTSLVSVSSRGEQGNMQNTFASISADGRYVAFMSNASNLVRTKTSGWNIFVRDLAKRTTSLVSASSAGVPGNGACDWPSISADGRYVVFESVATNLVAADTNGHSDIFVHDRRARTTTRLSVGPSGEQGDGPSQAPAVSADGRYVAFESMARNLLPWTWSGSSHRVFVHDQATHESVLVTGNLSGTCTTHCNPRISADGRFVAFSTDAGLVAEDTNLHWDAYVFDQVGGISTRASVSSEDAQGNWESFVTSISADGRHVAFDSLADNLVADDVNLSYDVLVRDRLLSSSSEADVRLAVTARPRAVRKGKRAKYTLTISNDGPDDAPNVTLIDVISKGRALSLAPSQGECRPAAVSVCTLGTLPSGTSATVVVTLKALGNPLFQTLTAGAEPRDIAPDNNSASVRTRVRR